MCVSSAPCVNPHCCISHILGRYKGLQVCPGLARHRSVFGDVQENQIKSQVVSDEAQQHHRVPPKPDILVQHPEHTSS